MGHKLAAFREGLADLGLTNDQLTGCLGGACYDCDTGVGSMHALDSDSRSRLTAR